MRFFATAPLVALAYMAASPVRAADDAAPVVLEPSSQWVIDFAEDKCRLIRTFGPEDSRHTLVFEQGGPDSTFGLTAAGPRLERFRSTRTSVRFGEFPPYVGRTSFTGTLGAFGAALIWSGLSFAPDEGQDSDFDRPLYSLPEIDLAQAAMVDSISIRQGKREVVFNTGKLTEAVKVLNRCAQDLLNSWGLDLDRHRTATRLPVWTNPEKVVKDIQASYPESALSKGEQAIIRMRAIVDETGKVADCKLVEATITESLESSACRAMLNATFEPALDRDGVPMSSYYTANIVYRIN